jgi:hypothetical protein
MTSHLVPTSSILPISAVGGLYLIPSYVEVIGVSAVFRVAPHAFHVVI